MKRTLCFLGLLLLATAAWPQAGKSGGTEQAIADLEQKWLQSQKANNPDLIAPSLADKFVATSAEGKVRGKADFLKEEKATKYSSIDYGDVKVTAYGDSAVAIGSFKAKGTDPAGKSFDLNERFTDTWVKTSGGKWQCVATASSSIKK